MSQLGQQLRLWSLEPEAWVLGQVAMLTLNALLWLPGCAIKSCCRCFVVPAMEALSGEKIWKHHQCLWKSVWSNLRLQLLNCPSHNCMVMKWCNYRAKLRLFGCLNCTFPYFIMFDFFFKCILNPEFFEGCNSPQIKHSNISVMYFTLKMIDMYSQP